MAVVQISRIQHRRGLEQDFPQLASAELGWSIDSRRLFIGNGLLSEGAPEEGTTEILTVYTDIIALLKTYNYKGLAGGTTVITGASVMSPVTRTIQSKLDEYVSVKDFGAVGDGITDDTQAIQRALQNLWPTESFNKAYAQHRTLYFPAGVYLVSGAVILIPPFTKIVGDGNFSTRIKQIDNTQDAVFRLCDSYYQTGSLFGKPDPVFSNPPETSHYYMSDMTIERTSNDDCLWIDGGNNIVFDRCNFVGKISSTEADSFNNTCITDTGTAGVRLNGKSYNNLFPIRNTVFNNCTFKNSATGVRIENSSYGTTFVGCHFFGHFRGVVMGEYSGGRDSPATDLYPRGVSLTGNHFDRIANCAVQGYADSGIVMSTGNLYENVGYGGYDYDDHQSPLSEILNFSTHGSGSINDAFYRVGSDRFIYPVIADNGFQATYINPEEGFQMGRLFQSAGFTATLLKNTLMPIAIVNELGVPVYMTSPGVLSYVISRNGINRSGVMRVNWTGTDVFWDEEYSESADIGITLSAEYNNPVQPVIIYYSATDTLFDATIKFDIKYHTIYNSPL